MLSAGIRAAASRAAWWMDHVLVPTSVAVAYVAITAQKREHAEPSN